MMHRNLKDFQWRIRDWKARRKLKQEARNRKKCLEQEAVEESRSGTAQDNDISLLAQNESFTDQLTIYYHYET